MAGFFNFADVVDRLAEHDRAGLIFVDEHGHRRDYLFSEISQHSGRYAGALRTLGVEAGRSVLVCASNSAKCLFAMLGLQRLGAVSIPCAKDLPAAELREIARANAAKWVVCDRTRRTEAAAVRAGAGIDHFLLIGEEAQGWERLDRLAENSRGVINARTQSSDPACVLQGAIYNQASLQAAVESSNRVLLAGRGDVVWCALPMGSASWFANVYVAPWSCGAATVVHDAPFQPVERLDLLRELDVSILLQPAPEYAAQVQTSEIAHFRGARLHRCLSVGAPVDSTVAGLWLDAMHIPIEDAAGGVTLGNR